MKIGITYDLKDDYLAEGFSEEEAAEFDKLETIDGIDKALRVNGFLTERIGNVKSLLKQILAGKRWDLVFNICEGVYGIGREAQVPAVLDVFNIPYVFSDVMVLSLTLHKGMTKHVIRDLGIPTADFAIAETPGDAEKINLPFPLFAKPVAEGTGKGIDPSSKINTRAELAATIADRLKKYNQPVLVETYLPGREFTVGIAGTGNQAFCTGIMEVKYRGHIQSDIYSYDNKENYAGRIDYLLPEKEMIDQCFDISLQAWRGLGCRDGGRIDLRCDARGIPNFIEVNPLAGLNPIHSDLPILSRMSGTSYEQLIKMIVDSAISRINPKNI
jgi:D-alanine-D-alanine ligase